MSKGVSIFGLWEPPPAKTPGQKFQRSSRDNFEANTPRPFVSQHNFGKANPGHAIVEPDGASPVSKETVKFSIPHAIKTPCFDRK
jgi:hypothetical protein